MKNAKIIASAPYLLVSDLTRALDYYCDVLGFTRPKLWGDPPFFAMPDRDGFVVMLHQPEQPTALPNSVAAGGAWDVYFWVSDADELFAELKSSGAKVEAEPSVQDYGIKEFVLRDLDGHILAFGQHWPPSTV